MPKACIREEQFAQSWQKRNLTPYMHIFISALKSKSDVFFCHVAGTNGDE